MTLGLNLFAIKKAMQNQTLNSFSKGNLYQRGCSGLLFSEKVLNQKCQVEFKPHVILNSKL